MVATERTTATTMIQAMRRDRLVSPKMVEMPGIEMPGGLLLLLPSVLMLAKGPSEDVS